MLFYLRVLALILLTLLISPFLVCLTAAVLLFNLMHRFTRFTRQPVPSDDSLPSGLASIIILNWNGKDLLEQGLPSIIEAVRVDGQPHEILVVDNGSSDGSLEYLAEYYPDVPVIALGENLGFAEGNNAGVRASKHDIVVLLNNDMIVDPGFLRPLLQGFGPRTFAVSSQIYLQDPGARREETGKTAALFRRGMIDYFHRNIPDGTPVRPYYPVFWAGGGSSAFHKKRFLLLGGFQGIYSPAYVEDTDLSYQAWKAGWDVLFAPGSRVYHRHRASSQRRFSPRKLQCLIQRNQFLFIWKNIRGWRLLLSHFCFLPWNCYRLARDYGITIWRCLFQAALRLPYVKLMRLRTQYRAARTDKEIFELFENPGLFFSKDHGAVKRQPDEISGMRPRILWLTAYLPHLGRHAGAGRMFHMLAQLSQRYRITLLTFLESDEERIFLPEVETLCERVIAVRRQPPVRWRISVYEPFDEFLTPQMREAMDYCLEEYDYDLIQLEYTQMACYANKRLRIPTLLTKHEVDFSACGRRVRVETNPARKLFWFYRYLQVLDLEAKLARDPDEIICMTDKDAHELKKFVASVPVHVVNTGVDLEYFRPPQSPATRPRLVFVGAFQHEPNGDAMIYFCREILPLIRSEIPETELVIVGSNPPQAILSLSEIPQVHVTGFVPDIRPFMASSSVYVVPLRLGVGIRGKILEAWSMGMAVVATSIACAGLKYEDGKNLMRADSGKLFATHVVTLLNDPAMRTRLGAEGRGTVEAHYGWRASADKLDALYRSHIGPAARVDKEA